MTDDELEAAQLEADKSNTTLGDNILFDLPPMTIRREALKLAVELAVAGHQQADAGSITHQARRFEQFITTGKLAEI